jgi:hypothetical protein
LTDNNDPDAVPARVCDRCNQPVTGSSVFCAGCTTIVDDARARHVQRLHAQAEEAHALPAPDNRPWRRRD